MSKSEIKELDQEVDRARVQVNERVERDGKVES